MADFTRTPPYLDLKVRTRSLACIRWAARRAARTASSFYGWVLAFIGAFTCLAGCELYKCWVKHFNPPPI